MKKNILTLISILLIASFALAACAAPATEAPVVEEPAVEAPAAEEPAAEEPAAEEPAAPAEVVEVTFWHAYGTGSAEEIALAKILEQAETDLPQYKINVLQVPFNDIYNKYRTDVAAGGGPDMFIAPNDSLGDDARSGLIADISSLAADKLGDYAPLAVEGMSVDGKLYGIPESLKAVAFWYNTDLLPEAPKTTAELQALMEGGTPVSLSYGCYHHYGFFGAFGGQIFDADWKVVADQGGVAEAMDYLNSLYAISIANGWPRNDSDGLAPFAEGKVAAITNGNWAMGDYKAALGDKLAVAALPAGPAGPASPMLGVDGFYFNPNMTDLQPALDVALYLTGQNAQLIMMNEAGHVPARTDVEITDPLIQGLVDAFTTGYVRPQVPELGLYWSNFCGTDEVFEKGVPAADWVATGTANANK
jgi:arabinogalactan oligomer / maltooligosaccharide transport system substrate-binding protein